MLTVSKVLNVLKYRQLPPNSLLTRNVACLASRLVSSVGAWRHREQFQSVKYFCLFVGHERSGHSLVGALLDAHPHMVIAHEFDTVRHLAAVQHLAAGMSEWELYYQLLERSRWFARRNAEWTGYKYAVPSQYKGSYTSLEVIGDKKGAGTSLALAQNPELITELRHLLSVPIKMIHVCRHPLDNIATIARKDQRGDIDAGIDSYFRRCEGVRRALECTPAEHWLTVPLEAFIDDTKVWLATISDFLGVEYTSSYLSDCAEIVFDTPNRSRENTAFTSGQVERIRREAAGISFLDRYDF